MLPDIDTLAKLLLNADSPKPANYLRPTAPPDNASLNAAVYGPDQAGNTLPAGAIPNGRFPSELARLLRQMRATHPHTALEGHDHG